MAQCYAESKPLGGTFDMCGGAFTGRLYCSGYGTGNLKQFQSYSKYTTSANSTSIDRGNALKQKEWSRVPDQKEGLKKNVEESVELNKVKGCLVQRLTSKEVVTNSAPTEANRMSSALTLYKAPCDEASKPPIRDGLLRKSDNLSGELMPKKGDSLQMKSPSSGGVHRSNSDGMDQRSPGKAATKSGSSSVRSSGEISEMESSSGGQASKPASGNGLHNSPGASSSMRLGTSGSRAATTANQSWPNSPANLRPLPRTRNLSEGSFSMIFPEESLNGSGSRSSITSPSRERSKDSMAFDGQGKLGSKLNSEKASEKVSFSGQQSSRIFRQSDVDNAELKRSSALDGGVFKGALKRGELKEVAGKTRSYTGSPPRKEVPFIRHSRNVSDGNWAAINSFRGTNISKSNLSAAKSQGFAAEKYVATPAPCVKPNSSGKSSTEAMNGGFVTGGSFARSSAPALEKVPIERTPEVATSSYGNITKGVGLTSGNVNCKKSPTESYGTGNVYLMGESMLLKKALSSKDPEEVKNIGNDQYKKGHFLEALSLYDRAITLSPDQAPYHSNRAAALAALGRLVEAVQECQQAVILDPKYLRAHHRLGTLFLRLGRTEDSRKHFKAAGPIDAGDIQRVDIIDLHLTKCHEARKSRDWHTLVKESDATLVAGADSSVQAYALKAEALLNLNRVNEAEKLIAAAKRLTSAAVKLKHVPDERILNIVQANIDLAQGRFEEAVTAAEKASLNEPYNAEVSAFEKKVRRIGRARSIGNDLFKAGKYFEASAAYGEGLELDPANAILFCNRGACRSKLRLWEKAIEDCNAALSIQPNYTKALLRRAQCNSELERWEDALRDYEILKGKLPGDVEVARALFDVQVSLKKSRGEEIYKLRFGGEIEEVYSPDQFKEAVTSPGLAVVHFITRWSERCRQITPFIDQLSKRYPSVNFVKVDIEDHPFLAKTESVGTVPTFKMYKNGLKVTEMLGPSQQKLEDAVQHYIF